MKKLLKKIFDGIKKAYNMLTGKTKDFVPVAIKIVNAVKTAMDGSVDDIILFVIKKSIPGEADDVIIDKIKSTVEKWLPKILLELTLIKSIADIEDKNEQLKVILTQLKLSSDETQNIFYHGLASLILEKLSDGELSWSDSVAITEYYYRNFIKNK